MIIRRIRLPIVALAALLLLVAACAQAPTPASYVAGDVTLFEIRR